MLEMTSRVSPDKWIAKNDARYQAILCNKKTIEMRVLSITKKVNAPMLQNSCFLVLH